MDKKFVLLSLLSSAVLVGCGGSNSSSPTPTPTPGTQFTLDVKLNGLAEPVKFQWLAKEYTVSASQKITASAQSYSAPSGFVYPADSQCQPNHSQVAGNDYQLTLDCQKAQTYQLQVELSNVSGNVGFSWLGQSYTLSASKTLSAKAFSYLAPTAVSTPSAQTCTNQHSQVTELSYKLAVSCQTTPPANQNTQVRVNGSLPYSVSLLAGSEIVALPAGSQALDLEAPLSLEQVKIAFITGPAQCWLNAGQSASELLLNCEEFSLVNDGEQAKIVSVSQPNGSALLESQGITVNSALQSYFGSLLIDTNKGIYQLDRDNGVISSFQQQVADGHSVLVRHGVTEDTVYALGSQGLLSLVDGDWQTVQKTTTSALSFLHSSGPYLSWLGKKADSNQLDLYQRKTGGTNNIFSLPAAAAKTAGVGTIHSSDVDLTAFWDNSGNLGYMLPKITNPSTLQYLTATELAGIWQQDADNQRLVALRSGAVQMFKGDSSTNSFGWQSLFTTTADRISVHGEVIWAAKADGDWLTLSEVYNGQQQLAKLIAASASSQPLQTQWHYTESTLIKPLVADEIRLGMTLLWQANAVNASQGTLWVSDGVNLLKAAQNVERGSYAQYRVLAVGKTQVVLSTPTGLQRLAR